MARIVSLLALVLPITVLAGCTDFDPDPGGNRIGIVGIDVRVLEVRAGSLSLEVLTTLDNLAAPSGELVLAVKAYDDTRMLAANTTAEVGVMEKDRSKVVPVALALPRSSSYRFMVQVIQDDRIVQKGEVTASNLAALEPTIHDTGLRIGEVNVQIIDVVQNRTHLKVTFYITNEGDADSAPLRGQVKAREVSTNILADEAWADVPSVGPDATHIAEVRLTVPDRFNYVLEAALWQEAIIVERGSGKVQLLPTFTKERDHEIVVSDPDISLFRVGGRGVAGDVVLAYSDHGGGAPREEAYYGEGGSYADGRTDEKQSPGPLLVVSLLGLAGLVLWRRHA